MMHPFFVDYIERIDWFYNELAKAITDVPQEGLDWVPGEEMNSLCVLIMHITGATRYWVGDVALGEVSGRDRASEFAAKGFSADALKAKLTESSAYIQYALGKINMDDFGKMMPAPGRDRQFGLGWSILHALEHIAMHTGHAQMTRQLWDQRQG